MLDSGHVYRVQKEAVLLVTSPKFKGPNAFEAAKNALQAFAIQDKSVLTIQRNVRR